MQIRKMTPQDDFDAIGSIYACSWQVAYKGIVPQDYLDSLSAGRWSAVLRDSSYDAYVLLDGESYVGTSSIGPSRDERMAGWGEILSLYLLPEYWGRGWAEPLLCTVVEALAAKGFQERYLWVLEENARARRFYEKQGFSWSGERQMDSVGGKALAEVRYVSRRE